MPKAKVSGTSVPVTTTSRASRTPVKINTGGTPLWYKVIMFGLMLVGLAWLVVNYLAGTEIAFLLRLGPWNYAIGFGFFVLGLVMTVGWR